MPGEIVFGADTTGAATATIDPDVLATASQNVLALEPALRSQNVSLEDTISDLTVGLYLSSGLASDVGQVLLDLDLTFRLAIELADKWPNWSILGGEPILLRPGSGLTINRVDPGSLRIWLASQRERTPPPIVEKGILPIATFAVTVIGVVISILPGGDHQQQPPQPLVPPINQTFNGPVTIIEAGRGDAMCMAWRQPDGRWIRVAGGARSGANQLKAVPRRAAEFPDLSP